MLCLQVFAHKETCSEETAVERGVAKGLAKLEGLGVRLDLIWGGTLYHLDDLPFSSAELPDVYTQFRKVLCIFFSFRKQVHAIRLLLFSDAHWPVLNFRELNIIARLDQL
jgi:hypothetical protein